MSEDDKRLCLKALEIMRSNHIIAGYTYDGIKRCIADADLIYELGEAPGVNVGKWISIKYCFPKDYTRCLIRHLVYGRTALDVAVYNHGEFAVETGMGVVYWDPGQIDYWLEIPEWRNENGQEGM